MQRRFTATWTGSQLDEIRDTTPAVHPLVVDLSAQVDENKDVGSRGASAAVEGSPRDRAAVEMIPAAGIVTWKPREDNVPSTGIACLPP